MDSAVTLRLMSLLPCRASPQQDRVICLRFCGCDLTALFPILTYFKQLVFSVLAFPSGQREQTFPSAFCVSVWLSEDPPSPQVTSSWGLNYWVECCCPDYGSVNVHGLNSISLVSFLVLGCTAPLLLFSQTFSVCQAKLEKNGGNKWYKLILIFAIEPWEPPEELGVFLAAVLRVLPITLELGAYENEK